MAGLGRPGMSDERKQELWDRWKGSVGQRDQPGDAQAGRIGFHNPALQRWCGSSSSMPPARTSDAG